MPNQQVQDDLENDVLFDTFARLQILYSNHKGAVIGGITAIILIIGGAIGYHYYSKAQDEKAIQLMSDATNYYMNGNYDLALSGSDEDLTVGFQQIIDNYPNTKAGNIAYYYAAVSEYNLGNFEQAANYMEGFDAPEGILGVGPISFHALVMTDLGNYSEAVKLYIKAAEWDKNDATTPYNYFKAALAYNEMGNQDKAREYAQKVINQYSSSSETVKAQKLMGRLMASSEG